MDSVSLVKEAFVFLILLTTVIETVVIQLEVNLVLILSEAKVCCLSLGVTSVVDS